VIRREIESRTPFPRHVFHLTVVAALCILCVASYAPTTPYRNDTDQPVAVRLQDGSVMHLGPQSEADITYTPSSRHATLVRGKVMFDVAHDATRPFCLQSPGMIAQDVGTRFAASLRDGRTIIDVYDGSVALNGAARACRTTSSSVDSLVPEEALTLAQGESAEIVPAATGSHIHRLAPGPIALARSPAWLPKLHLTGLTLAEAIEQFNRHNCQQLRIVNPKIATIHASGVWDATDLADFIRSWTDDALSDTHKKIHASALAGGQCRPDPIRLE